MHIDVGQAHRLLSALKEAGWVYQTHDQSWYRLTGRLLQVAGELLGNIDLVRAARPLIVGLASETGYTVGLMELRGDSLFLVAREQGSEIVQVVLRAGDRVPLAETAGGRAVLASLLNTGNVVDVDAHLKERLKEIQRRGFSVDNEEYRPGVRTLAAAIIGHDQMPIGAVGVMTPSALVSEHALSSLGPIVASCAAQISRSFGGHSLK
jgi:DNA-binding IclR family transcriptional regulator